MVLHFKVDLICFILYYKDYVGKYMFATNQIEKKIQWLHEKEKINK